MQFRIEYKIFYFLSFENVVYDFVMATLKMVTLAYLSKWLSIICLGSYNSHLGGFNLK